MTQYTHQNLPDELNAKPLPEEMFGEAFAAFSDAVFSGHCAAREIKAAYVYARKGFMESEPFGGKRRSPYGTAADDVVMQVTIRIPHPGWCDELRKAEMLETVLIHTRLNDERERLEAEIAAEEAAAAKAAESAAQKREQLKVLNGEKK